MFGLLKLEKDSYSLLTLGEATSRQVLLKKGNQSEGFSLIEAFLVRIID